MKLQGISSMATRQVLAGIATLYQQQSEIEVHLESVGGVDAARRVRAGEAFDLIALASDAIEALMKDGHIVPGTRMDFVRSKVAVAVRTGTAHPGIDSEEALRKAVLAASGIGYSTGPSGTAMLKLFARWGVMDAVASRLVQATSGVPVGQLVASGEAALGFQQLSELIDVPQVDVVGLMPPGCEIVTTFSAGLGVAAAHPAQARELLAFLCSDATADLKRRYGMEAA